MTLATAKLSTSGLVNSGVLLFWFLIVALIPIGCVVNSNYQKQSLDSHYPASFYIENIHFFPQEEFQCGPSVLASVLNYFGYKIVPEEISKVIYLRRIEGTLNMDMVSFAKGYEKDGRIAVSEAHGDIELIKKDITDGHPVIAFVDLGFWDIRKGHYMLIVGYDDIKGGIIANSGIEKDKFISYNRFLKIWERGGYWALRIVPE